MAAGGTSVGVESFQGVSMPFGSVAGGGRCRDCGGVHSMNPHGQADTDILVGEMADVSRKPLTTVQKVGRFFFLLGGVAFLVGIAPYLLMLLLMAARIIDPTLNPVGMGILFLVSCPAFIILMLIGVFCRYLISD
jgi:hypothetical protein